MSWLRITFSLPFDLGRIFSWSWLYFTWKIRGVWSLHGAVYNTRVETLHGVLFTDVFIAVVFIVNRWINYNSVIKCTCIKYSEKWNRTCNVVHETFFFLSQSRCEKPFRQIVLRDIQGPCNAENVWLRKFHPLFVSLHLNISFFLLPTFIKLIASFWILNFDSKGSWKTET